MKIAGRKFINIRKIVENLETDVAANLSQIHAVTGFDTTSFLHVFGKIKVLQKMFQWKSKTQASKRNWCFM